MYQFLNLQAAHNQRQDVGGELRLVSLLSAGLDGYHGNRATSV